VSELYATGLRTIRASEITFFIVEEFTLNQSPWDARATAPYKGPFAMEIGNESAPHALSFRCALPSNQGCDVGTCSLFQFLIDFAYGRRASKKSLRQGTGPDWV